MDLISLSNPLFPEERGQIKSSVFNRIIETIALAEHAFGNSQNQPWLQNEKLGRRRKAYMFDHTLNGMINYVNYYGRFQAEIIDCGKSGYSRVELKNDIGNIIHFFNNFNPSAKYLQEYLKLNSNLKTPKYGIIEYSFDKKMNCVSDLTLAIPDCKGKTIGRSANLLTYYQNTKARIDFNLEPIVYLGELRKQNSIVDKHLEPDST